MLTHDCNPVASETASLVCNHCKGRSYTGRSCLLEGLVTDIWCDCNRNILGMLSDNARQMGPLRDKLQWVEVWLRRRNLSEQLGRRVRAYYTEIWAHNKGHLCFCCFGLHLARGPSPLPFGLALALWPCTLALPWPCPPPPPSWHTSPPPPLDPAPAPAPALCCCHSCEASLLQTSVFGLSVSIGLETLQAVLARLQSCAQKICTTCLNLFEQISILLSTCQ